MPRISHPGQHRQQARPVSRAIPGQLNKVAESRVAGDDGGAGMVPLR
jgi:hypothetical protein